MNRDRVASGTQWTAGDSVDGELQVRRVTYAEDGILSPRFECVPRHSGVDITPVARPPFR